MKILGGYLKTTAGEVLVAGRDPQKISLEARVRVAWGFDAKELAGISVYCPRSDRDGEDAVWNKQRF